MSRARSHTAGDWPAARLLQFAAGLSICLYAACAAGASLSTEGATGNKLTNQQLQPTTNNNQKLETDAPKFYHLNELLYKTTQGHESPQAAALPNFMRPLEGSNKMGQLKPRGMMSEANADEESSIEGLVRMMSGRGARPQATATDAIGARGPANGARIGPDDEATIQRKSTNLDEDAAGPPETDGSPSRVKARDNIPRRKRRASARPAPPKLKSRRVSRNSRRRKLRHGVKPRRRA